MSVNKKTLLFLIFLNLTAIAKNQNTTLQIWSDIKQPMVISYVLHPRDTPIEILKTDLINGKNTIQIDLKENRVLYLKIGEIFQTCYFEPNQYYNISITNEPTPRLLFFGTNRVINNQIYELNQVFQLFSYGDKPYYEWGKSEFVGGISKLSDIMYKHVHTESSSISTAEREFLHNYIESIINSQVLNFAWSSYNPYDSLSTELPDFFKKRVNDFPLSAAKLIIHNESYLIALQEYENFYIESLISNTSREFIQKNLDWYLKIIYHKIRSSEFEKDIKSFFLATIFYDLLDVKPPANFSEYLDLYISDYPQNSYYHSIKNKLDKLNRLSKESVSPTIYASNILEEHFSINKKYSGKIIYLDFWATWCGPCIKEMPAFQKLKENYRADSRIVFIKVSIDQDIDKWKNIVSKNKISINDNNYILNQENRTQVWDSYVLNSIPRYIIFSKDGNILDANAPRPSDPKLKELLDELLKEER